MPETLALPGLRLLRCLSDQIGAPAMLVLAVAARSARCPWCQCPSRACFSPREAYQKASRLHREWRRTQIRLTKPSCHSFRATGVTNYLDNGGQLDQAQMMCGHAQTKTTKMYDRREQRIRRSEVERINLKVNRE